MGDGEVKSAHKSGLRESTRRGDCEARIINENLNAEGFSGPSRRSSISLTNKLVSPPHTRPAQSVAPQPQTTCARLTNGSRIAIAIAPYCCPLLLLDAGAKHCRPNPTKPNDQRRDEANTALHRLACRRATTLGVRRAFAGSL